MIVLKDYPRLERLAKGSPDVGLALNRLPNLYKSSTRVSGRPVIQHCLETAELASHFTTDVKYLIAAILHDCREDLLLSFSDVNQISGRPGVAQMVTALTKRPDLNDREWRNREYLNLLLKAIEDDKWLGIVKLADRRSNLTDIQFLPGERRKAIAKETLDFYAPMALRLGLVSLASELKELSLPYVIENSGSSLGNGGFRGEGSIKGGPDRMWQRRTSTMYMPGFEACFCH